MFYVSCIVSQLTFSTGSIFKGGVGSELVSLQTVLWIVDALLTHTRSKLYPSSTTWPPPSPI